MAANRSPNGVKSREVRLLEDILTRLAATEVLLRCLETRLVQTMRTMDDASNVADVSESRVEINQARRLLATFHPNRLED